MMVVRLIYMEFRVSIEPVSITPLLTLTRASGVAINSNVSFAVISRDRKCCVSSFLDGNQPMMPISVSKQRI
jgi:hypothetical protein